MAKSSNAKTRRRNGRGNGGQSYRLFDDMLAMAGSLANSRKEYAANKLETFADSVREVSSSMAGIPNLRAYASAAAESLEGLAGYVSDSDLETMVADAREFTRRHPMTTLAGSIAAGVIITQMMQSRTSSGASRRGGARRHRASA